VHGFHDHDHADEFQAERLAANPKQFFGFQVGDRWVST
jgi:hypothetical protein